MKNSTASFGMIVAAGEAAKRAARLASSIAEVACADLPLQTWIPAFTLVRAAQSNAALKWMSFVFMSSVANRRSMKPGRLAWADLPMSGRLNQCALADSHAEQMG